MACTVAMGRQSTVKVLEALPLRASTCRSPVVWQSTLPLSLSAMSVLLPALPTRRHCTGAFSSTDPLRVRTTAGSGVGRCVLTTTVSESVTVVVMRAGVASQAARTITSVSNRVLREWHMARLGERTAQAPS